MRSFRLEQSGKEITFHAGVVLIGAAITKFTSLTKSIDFALPNNTIIHLRTTSKAETRLKQIYTVLNVNPTQ